MPTTEQGTARELDAEQVRQPAAEAEVVVADGQPGYAAGRQPWPFRDGFSIRP